MSKRIFTTVIILILIGLSFVLGYWFKEISQTSTERSKIAELEGSSLIQSWIFTAYGEITGISGRTITLTNKEESLGITIKDDAGIFSVSFVGPPVEGTVVESEKKEITFEELKVGDNINVVIEIASDGALEGINVMVLEKIPND